MLMGVCVRNSPSPEAAASGEASRMDEVCSYVLRAYPGSTTCASMLRKLTATLYSRINLFVSYSAFSWRVKNPPCRLAPWLKSSTDRICYCIPNTLRHDQRFHRHQNLLRHSGRSPNTGPNSIFTEVTTSVLRTKWVCCTGSGVM
jgi:hypothetical protein